MQKRLTKQSEKESYKLRQQKKNKELLKQIIEHNPADKP